MPKYSRLKAASPKARCSCARNSSLKSPPTSAVAFSRSHDGSSLLHMVQNGSVRLQAVDSIAKRASGRRARIGRRNELLGKPRGLIGNDPATHREAPDRVIAARERQHPGAVLELEAKDVVGLKFGADLQEIFLDPPDRFGALPLRGTDNDVQTTRIMQHEMRNGPAGDR